MHTSEEWLRQRRVFLAAPVESLSQAFAFSLGWEQGWPAGLVAALREGK